MSLTQIKAANLTLYYSSRHVWMHMTNYGLGGGLLWWSNSNDSRIMKAPHFIFMNNLEQTF